LQSTGTLDDIVPEKVKKAWLRWTGFGKERIAALPKGYLWSRPGRHRKTFMVECLAGEAMCPSSNFKNLSDKR
jgi:hypothetical protein